jgi:hypothetical protein
MNGDGNLDLVATQYDLQSVAILLGNGQGSFGDQLGYPYAGSASSPVIRDLDDRDSKTVPYCSAHQRHS